MKCNAIEYVIRNYVIGSMHNRFYPRIISLVEKEKVTIKVRNGFAIQVVDNIDKWESKK